MFFDYTKLVSILKTWWGDFRADRSQWIGASMLLFVIVMVVFVSPRGLVGSRPAQLVGQEHLPREVREGLEAQISSQEEYLSGTATTHRDLTDYSDNYSGATFNHPGHWAIATQDTLWFHAHSTTKTMRQVVAFDLGKGFVETPDTEQTPLRYPFTLEVSEGSEKEFQTLYGVRSPDKTIPITDRLAAALFVSGDGDLLYVIQSPGRPNIRVVFRDRAHLLPNLPEQDVLELRQDFAAVVKSVRFP